MNRMRRLLLILCYSFHRRRVRVVLCIWSIHSPTADPSSIHQTGRRVNQCQRQNRRSPDHPFRGNFFESFKEDSFKAKVKRLSYFNDRGALVCKTASTFRVSEGLAAAEQHLGHQVGFWVEPAFRSIRSTIAWLIFEGLAQVSVAATSEAPGISITQAISHSTALKYGREFNEGLAP